MLRIAIDARFAVGVRRGIGIYSLNLIKEIARLDHENNYTLFIDQEDKEEVLPKQKNFKIKMIKPSIYPIWEQILLPYYLFKNNIDILHCHGNTGPIIFPSKLKLILTLHDVSFMKPYNLVPKSPILYQRLGRFYRKLIAPLSALRSSKIITVSNFAKKDILSHIKDLSPDIVDVTYLASNSDYFKEVNEESTKKTLEDFNIKSPFLLTLGGRDPQKNVLFTIRNFCELKDKMTSKTTLVVVGISSEAMSPYLEITKEYNAVHSVIFIDYLSQDKLQHLYKKCELFIFASLYESFGLPPLEALSCGTPVFLSNKGALPEISQNAACYFDPTDDLSFQNGLLTLLNNHDLTHHLSKKAKERSSLFTWEKLAMKTIDIYYNAIQLGLIQDKKQSGIKL